MNIRMKTYVLAIAFPFIISTINTTPPTHQSHHFPIKQIQPHHFRTHKNKYFDYLQTLQTKARIGSWLPNSLLQLFGGKNATIEEINSLNRLFGCEEKQLRLKLEKFGTPADRDDINEVLDKFHALKPEQRTKDRLIELLHPVNAKRLGLTPTITRPQLVRDVQNKAKVIDDNYFKGMVFSLFILYLYDNSLI